jgi:hypothetical protein
MARDRALLRNRRIIGAPVQRDEHQENADGAFDEKNQNRSHVRRRLFEKHVALGLSLGKRLSNFLLQEFRQ